VEYGTKESLILCLSIFLSLYSPSNARKILSIEDKNGHSVMTKYLLKNKNYDVKKDDMQRVEKEAKMTLELILENPTDFSKYLESNLDNNKIWNYLRDEDVTKLKEYVQERASKIMDENNEIDEQQAISMVVNEQRRSNLSTPLHLAIKYQNLPVIRCLVYDFNADTSIENKDGHDPVEYLHLGDVNSGNLHVNL
jgi:ankyrin repeat protein